MKMKNTAISGLTIIGAVFIAIGLVFFIIGVGFFRAVPTVPEEADTFPTLAIVFSGIGVFWGGLGAAFLIGSSSRGVSGKRLIENGKRVSATVTSCDVNRTVSVNGISPFRLTCEDADGTVFRSKNSYKDLTGYVGRSIDVYIDPKKPGRYFVDIDSALGEEVDVLAGMREADAKRSKDMK